MAFYGIPKILAQKHEDLSREHAMSDTRKPFIMQKIVANVSEERNESVTEKGLPNMVYPSSAGSLFNLSIKLNRVYMITKMDLKQLFKKPYETEADGGYVEIADVKTAIKGSVQDLKSLITAHDLGTYDVYDDYTFRIKWSKKVELKSADNTTAINLWIKAIGLTLDTIYTAQSTTTLSLEDIVIQTPFIMSVVTNNNNSIFPVYGESSSILTIGQFIVYTPVGFEIDFYADKTVAEFEIERKNSHFQLELHHKATGIRLNKLTLGKSRIEIDLKGTLVEKLSK